MSDTIRSIDGTVIGQPPASTTVAGRTGPSTPGRSPTDGPPEGAAAGEQALHKALVRLKDRQRTILIVAHHPSALRTADKLLVLREGRVAAFGERGAMLRALMQQSQQQRVVAMQGGQAAMLPTSLEGGAGG